MAKRFVKSSIAVIATVSLLFTMCISASAASYTSTTTYYNSLEKIQVSTTVYDLAMDDQITYLAYKNADDSVAFDTAKSEIVYVNQYSASEGETTAKTFSYVTDASKIGSSIKMAKADSTFTNSATITPSANETGKIDGGTVAFNVKVDSAEVVTANVECEKGLQFVNIPVSLTGRILTDLKIGENTINKTDVIYTNTGIAVTLDVNAPAYDVVITTKADEDFTPAAPTAVAEALSKTDEYTAYSVIADAKNTPVNYEIGVAFSEEKITKDTNLETLENGAMFASSGGARGNDDKFAIIVQDEAKPTTGKIYYATYMKNGNEITIGSLGSITLDQPTAE